MIAIVTILSAFPLGFLVRSRLAANTAYAVAYLWAFVFQTLYLILEVINDSSDPAFEAQKFPWAYGLVAVSIFLAGFGLVALGHFVRDRRLARAAQPAAATA
jgi:uncharacterized membrane protein